MSESGVEALPFQALNAALKGRSSTVTLLSRNYVSVFITGALRFRVNAF
jgi:hypothetical protein